jgi:hypothetical protein
MKKDTSGNNQFSTMNNSSPSRVSSPTSLLATAVFDMFCEENEPLLLRLSPEVFHFVHLFLQSLVAAAEQYKAAFSITLARAPRANKT